MGGEDTPRSVYEQFRRAAGRAPHMPLLCYPASSRRDWLPDGREYSYGEALVTVDALAGRYRLAGYGPGHRVALLAGNRPEHFWHLFALNAVGASAVLLNPAYLHHELAYAIAFPDCVLALGIPDRIEDLRAVCAGLPAPVPVLDVTDLPAAFPSPPLPSAPAADDGCQREALVIYTSGTTGRPKGCMIPNASCLAAGENYGTAGGLISFQPERERVYIPLPSFHMNVSVFTLNTMVRLRGCIIMQDRFSASTWWPDLVATRATCIHYLGIIPPVLLKAQAVPEETRHQVRFGLGAGIDPVIRERFEARFGFPLIEAWGMTETSRAIQNCDLPRLTAGRVLGRPRKPLEVLVADEADRPVPHGTPGELLVRAEGPDPRHGFFSGYLKQPEATEHSWRNGWFHTGDVVTQSADGVLYFVERRKNIIRRSGENIAAAEVEEALLVCPEVRGVAVLAVPDPLQDEEVLACVVLMPGVPATPVTAHTLMEQARTRLAAHKLPGWLVFVDDIPVTSTQKVRKDAIFPEGTDPREDPRAIDLREEKRQRRTAPA